MLHSHNHQLEKLFYHRKYHFLKSRNLSFRAEAFLKSFSYRYQSKALEFADLGASMGICGKIISSSNGPLQGIFGVILHQNCITLIHQKIAELTSSSCLIGPHQFSCLHFSFLSWPYCTAKLTGQHQDK